MNKVFFDLVSKNNRQDSEIKMQIGNYVSTNIFEAITFDKTILNEKYKCISSTEYYQYQYQNQYYNKYRDYHSVSYTDDLIDYDNYRGDTISYRLSIHRKKPIALFCQNMNYHNIVFIYENVWEITEDCQLVIYDKKNKNSSQNGEMCIRIKIPLSKKSLEKIIEEIEFLVKHKYDKKHKFHSLDSVLECEQPRQEEFLDK
jgi:hypothetical protein